MDVWYSPVKLEEASRIIAKTHTFSVQPSNVDISDNEVEKVVRKIIALDETRVQSYANTLTNREVFLLAWYIPENRLHVNLKRLIEVFDLRATAEAFRAFFHAWQNEFWNSECNIGICNKFSKNSCFQTVIKEVHLDQGKLQLILADKIGVPDGFNVLVGKNKFSPNLAFKEKLKYFGVYSDTKLYSECVRRFYLTCKHDDYKFAGMEALIGAYRSYNDQEKKLLLINILKEMDWNELPEFSKLFNEYKDITGNKHREKIAVYFEDVDQEIAQKFTDWYNMNNILRFFGMDERSLFWKNFRFEDVERFVVSRSIVMTFPEHVAVEFLGQAMGPIYVYQREIFDKYIKNLFSMKENAELRQMLYHDRRYKYRKEHRGYWQRDMASWLLHNNVTTRIGTYGKKRG